MKTLQIASVSDIHLGHRRNETREIIANLRRAFPDSPATAKLDLLVLVGDVYDGLLSLPDEEVQEIDFWIEYVLRMCKKHDIVLRVLEGTPSHDWKQSQRFVTINEITGIGADLKYVKDLSIEYIEKLDISVLYVPDEWDTTTERTYAQVQELLKAKGLAQVDFAFMHGQFEFQLPEHVKAQKHNSTLYLEIVKYLVFIGHVHTHSRYERIIAQGSFDRLSHGEEGPKGHVRATVRPNGEADVVFVENQHAKLFLTVDCTDLTLEQTLVKIEQFVQGLPDGSNVRVQAGPDNPVFTNMELLIRSHPMLTWSKKVDEVKQDLPELVEVETVYVPITLSKDNLEGLLLERLANNNADALTLQAAKSILVDAL